MSRCPSCGVQQGKLITHSDLMREYGLSRHAADAVMRLVPKITLPGFRRVFVRRDVVESRLRENETL